MISDPLRLQILEAVLREAHTVKQVAERLGQPPTKLYYHVRALEAAGYVTVVATRVKSGILEKYYRTTASNLNVDRQLLKASAVPGAPLDTMLAVVFDATVDDLRRSATAGLFDLSRPPAAQSGRLILSRSLCQLRRRDVPKFVARFQALLKELEAGPDATDVVSYGCTVAFYPRAETAPKKKASGRRRA